MDKYEIVVGLEIHAELNTATKAFCGCKNEFGAEVNTNTCPVCLGLPGALPMLNENVVKYAIKMGKACHSHIHKDSAMHRKNYFYADLPKGYQISQGTVPICEGGYLDYYLGETERRVRLNRIHMEEDTCKLLHEAGFSGTLIDYNRSGVPLIEIVTEPDLHSAEEVRAFLEAVKSTLLALNICDGKMQEGSIRCDVNVSVRPRGQAEYGTRVEMKNVATFSGAFKAVEYESNRQIAMLEKGEAFSQETRRWDDAAGVNVPMRTKENARDYRYLPEPDQLPNLIDDAFIVAVTIPELPIDRLRRYIGEYKLSAYDGGLLAENPVRARFFEDCVAQGATPKAASNWISGEIAAYLKENGIDISETRLTPSAVTVLTRLVESSTISNTAAKQVLGEMLKTGEDPKVIVGRLGLAQVSDEGALRAWVSEVVAENPKSIADFKAGKTNALGFLVGQCMKRSQGRGNPALIKRLLEDEIAKA